MSKKKILVFKLGAIGDALMTTPFIRQLHYNYPNYEIDYLIGKHSQAVLQNNSYINKLISIDENIFYQKKITALLKLFVTLFLKKYHKIYILHRDKYFYWYFYLLFTQIVGFRSNFFFLKDNFYSSPPLPHQNHHIYKYLNLLAKYNIEDYQLEINNSLALANKQLTNQEIKTKKKIQNIFSKDKINIFLNPGGGNNPGERVTVRQWGSEKYIKLIAKIQEDQKYKNKINFYLVGDQHDITLTKQIFNAVKKKNNLQNNIFNLSGKWNLTEFIFALQFADAFVTGDTGGMHLASASQIPTLSIFGPTDHKEIKPLGENHRFINTDVSCSPCYFGKFKGCNNFICMPSISVEVVWQELKNLLIALKK